MPEVINDGCPFCLDNGRMLSKVAETAAGYLAVPTDSPIPGAYLIIPKAHIADDRDLPDNWQVTRRELLEHVVWLYHQPARNTIINNGREAGQTVMHLHEWIVPRGGELPISKAYRLGPTTMIGRANKEARVVADNADFGID